MPQYRLEVSGQAVATLSGRTYYLGEHNSPEKRGQTTAPEPKKQQQPVDLTIVRATAESLSPTVVATVRVQVAAGARP
ncbi:hypothetical protein CEE69_08245 [Rhodopirellula bahusiensis]|uniref:Uncharacterized protein n=1 Tax=Rhodopirellula bahusiensis TaxID=2014065 RepID=A0A2G1WAD3_9BACT|nr:hypothetical protein CEE69_08245 [Rhodopirellula bahusiensis]